MWRQNLFQITHISPKGSTSGIRQGLSSKLLFLCKKEIENLLSTHYLRRFAFISYILTYRAPSLTKKDNQFDRKVAKRSSTITSPRMEKTGNKL